MRNSKLKDTESRLTAQRTIAERDEDQDFWKVWGCSDILSTPEGKLARAQLELVQWDISSYFEGKKTAKKSYLISAYDYINRKDEEILSFKWVCETLSLSPGAVKEAFYKNYQIDELMQRAGVPQLPF